jgi:hypothetical protein
VLYTHNPFYLISACLFVYGLKLLFRPGNSAMLFQQGTVDYMQPTGLLGSLAAVTLLMATTAVLIVRLGKVWEDARSLVLIVLLMLLAISVSFDELMTMAAEQEQGPLRIAVMMIMGALIAVGMVELLIRGLAVRLSWLWRLPLYAFLTLFFLWPLLLVPAVMSFSPSQIRWLIAAFPSVAALISLTLLPGIRKGSGSLRDNGTPWPWPWLPYTPFVFIALAVCARSYSLTISFDAPAYGGHFWDTMFGFYLLVPFFAAILILLIEIGITERRPVLASGALVVSPLLMLMAWPWGVPWGQLPSYFHFATEVTSTCGSPVYLTLLGLLLVSSWAWWRGVPRAETMTTGLLLIAAGMSPESLSMSRSPLLAYEWSAWPMLTLAVLKLTSGLLKNRMGQILTGLMILCAMPMVVSLPTGLLPWRAFITVHLAFVVVLFLATTRDHAGALRRFHALQLSMTLAVGAVNLLRLDQSLILIGCYAAGMTLIAAICFRMLRERWYLIVTLLHCTAAIAAVCGASVWLLSTARMESGMRQVIFGGLSFLAAVLISILKSTAGRRLRLQFRIWRRSLNTWIQASTASLNDGKPVPEFSASGQA